MVEVYCIEFVVFEDVGGGIICWILVCVDFIEKVKEWVLKVFFLVWWF